MKFLLFCSLFMFMLNVKAKEIKGTVSFKGKAVEGTLFIFAKRFKSKMPMPLAVLKVENPKFPYDFTLSENNKMIQSMPFEGPFTVTARISPSGSAMDKTGVESSTKKQVNIGDTNLKIELLGK